MRRSSVARSALLGLVVGSWSMVGCDEGRSDPPDAAMPDAQSAPPDASDDECTTLRLGRPSMHFNLFGQFLGLRYPVENELGEATPDSLLIELYDSTTPDLSTLEPGTYDLAAAPNDSLATCQHCLWVSIDQPAEGGLPPSAYWPSEGSLTLTTVSDPLETIIVGMTSRVVLSEATFDEAGNTTFQRGGACVVLEPLVVNTSPTPGATCASAEDCGNQLLEICDPRTARCAAPQCGEFRACAETDACLSQVGDGLEGACYRMCNPAEPTSCGSSGRCVQLGVDPTIGTCRWTGEAELGAACEQEDVSTSCREGVCSNHSGTCTSTCAFYDDAPGCPSAQRCSLFGVCEPTSAGDPAALGEPCAETAAMADGCGADDDAFRGICFSYEGPLTCQRTCLGDRGCAPEEFCALRFSSGLGVCLPDPVCGDGALGEIDELCDDGNTASDDGCSGDCRTVEYDVLCGGLPELAWDVSVEGATRGGTDGFQATCQAGIARAQLWRLTPPGPGRVRLVVTSEHEHAVSLRTDCDDAESELACATPRGVDTHSELTFQATSAAPLVAMVSAFTVLEEDEFTITTEFVAEQCGDGVIAGREVCDDGNTASDDGCRGDCREIEYDVWCEGATPVTTAAAVTGDNTGGPALYAASCGNTIYGSGPDRLHTFTATGAGTLRLRLDQGTTDLALAVYGGCGAPEEMEELGCSSVYDVEQVEVPVTAGQTVTVLVEGFSADHAGPYTLTAQLVP